MDFKPDEEAVPHLSGQKLVRKGGRSESRKGKDTDITTYDVVDGDGTVVATYEVRNSMSIYPPQTRSQEVRKI